MAVPYNIRYFSTIKYHYIVFFLVFFCISNHNNTILIIDRHHREDREAARTKIKFIFIKNEMEVTA